MRVIPDGFTAALMAIEGIRDARVFLHGPGGCRLYHMLSASHAYPRLDATGSYDYNIPYFFGHPRIPCTYIDGDDYVKGAYDKLEEGLLTTDDFETEMIVVIDSPGAALIGDDCDKAIETNNLNALALHMDQWLISRSFSEGFDITLTNVMKKFTVSRGLRKSPRVNILGLCILDRDWTIVRNEITELLGLMGIEANCFLGAGCTVGEITDAACADVNISLCPDMTKRQEAYLKSQFNIPTVSANHGAAIGFGAVRDILIQLARIFKVDPEKALDRVRLWERHVFGIYMGDQGISSRYRGMSIAVAGLASKVHAIVYWLYNYLALVPRSIILDAGSDSGEVEKLRTYLESIGCLRAMDDASLEADILLCESSTSKLHEQTGRCRAGIDIGVGSRSGLSVIPRPIYMIAGSLYILDEAGRALRGLDAH